jgi:hypothetical protein
MAANLAGQKYNEALLSVTAAKQNVENTEALLNISKE